MKPFHKMWTFVIFIWVTHLFACSVPHFENNEQMDQTSMTARFSDFKQVGLSDWEVVESAICYLSMAKNRKLIIDEDITVDRAILLPSNFTLELQADIFQADYTFDNVIRCANVVFDEEEVAKVPTLSISTKGYVPITYPTNVDHLSNIRILGNNHKIVASKHVPSAYHLYNKIVEPMIGDDWGSRGLTIAFTNCNNIEICNLEIRDAHCYSICFDLCDKGYIHDVNIYSPVNVNAELDGIDLRTGCTDFLIENIHAETGDDSIALNAGAEPTKTYPYGNRYLYPIEGGYGLWATLLSNEFNIKNIVVRNVLCKRVDVDGRGALILSSYGHEISEIVIDNFTEPEGSLHTPDDTVVLIYGGSNYTDDSIHDITINNIKATEAGKVVTARCKCNNVWLNNLQPKPGGVEVSLNYPNGFIVTNTNI